MILFYCSLYILFRVGNVYNNNIVIFYCGIHLDALESSMELWQLQSLFIVTAKNIWFKLCSQFYYSFGRSLKLFFHDLLLKWNMKRTVIYFIFYCILLWKDTIKYFYQFKWTMNIWYRNGPVLWPTRSLDLSALDFFFVFGAIKKSRKCVIICNPRGAIGSSY